MKLNTNFRLCVYITIVFYLISCNPTKTNTGISSNDTVNTSFNEKLSEITDKYWELIELSGKIINRSDSLFTIPNFILKSNGNKVNGKGSCNSFFGNYQLKEGNRITFSSLAHTEMYCKINMELEDQFLWMLQNIDSYTLNNDTLSLSKDKLVTLAQFVSVKPK